MSVRTIAAAALLTAGCVALASEAAPDTREEWYVSGNIGSNRALGTIEVFRGRITGRYAYGRIPWGGSEALELQGTVGADGAIAIDEIASIPVGERQDQIPLVSGRFTGRIDPARSRLTGTWSPPPPPEGRGGKPLPFELAAFARTVAWGERPDRQIGLLELVDPKTDLARLANAEVKGHAERVVSTAKADPHGPCCEYVPTYWSERVVSVVFTGSRGGEPFHEGLVFGYRNGKPARLAIGDVLAVGAASWPEGLDALVTSAGHAGLDCRRRLNGFAITNRGELHLFVACQPAADGASAEQEIAVPTRVLKTLLVPDGPAASVLRVRK